MEKLKHMKETLTGVVQTQLSGNLSNIDAHELGEVVDMIKDLEQAMYYCAMVKCLEEETKERKENKKHEKFERERYYTDRMIPYEWKRDMDREYGKMYYGEQGQGSDVYSPMRNRSMSYPMESRDYREGRSPQSRKMYMESKELHRNKEEQMKELEKYLKELSQDVSEMIEGSSPEEKQMLKQKVIELANKIN